ncbi:MULTISPECIES: hypothetical protein [unclassified Lactococcus]|uniref:hypothetical protein n=1 Tax=unclassified Lactococcus TaxID=2643510 RepID=UPI0011C79801|nr:MULTISPECIES: hypothetical protein [unclassified Lactococcus]MQW23270.1 hypothetical protein [Lactococcus sp. dk101]TXK38063.1 hypothetical protein FVP42_06530 [Lactococcus sp. dk310]TXK49742.1 hypothetical protein FVP43_06500 [Lactococcus sp. dk322]
MTNTDDFLTTAVSLMTRDITETVADQIDSFMKTQYKLKEKHSLGIISKQDLMLELGIVDGTVTKWEENGLDRYQPPYKTSLVFFKIDDVKKFLINK